MSIAFRTVATNVVVTFTVQSGAHGSWLALEGIGALLTACEGTARLLEVGHGNGRESGGGVVLGFVVVYLMHGNSRVYDVGLDSLLLDYWLNGFVDVVMYMLASNCWGSSICVVCLANFTGILELCLLGLETLVDVIIVAVMDFTLLNASEVVGMLLWENFLVLDRLDGSVVMILMNFAIHSRGYILVVSRCNVLVLDGRIDALMDGGGVFAILVEEVGNCCLGLIHFD